MRRAVVIATLGLVAWPTSASAFYGDGATIASADLTRLEQGDDSSLTPDVSADGRYVVFFTRARNFFADDDADPPGKYRVGGIFRRDLETGALVRVADGDLRKESDDSLLLRGARNPSVSADGQYVAFSTAQPLVPSDGNDGDLDVYVRDLARPTGAPGAFTLVSAKDGGDTAATYEPKSPPNTLLPEGSEVWPGSSISADGRKVAFRTEGTKSNLPASAAVDVPGRQIYVRDLDARTTGLLTRDKTTQAPAGGAAGPAGISGDGTTVAWTGANGPAQTRMLNGETAETDINYYLWRRIADGPLAATRRVTGMADPDDPACPPGAAVDNSPGARGPCEGPLTTQEQAFSSIGTQLPSLSDDGYTVAFTTPSTARPDVTSGPASDLWITDMRPGVSRKAGSVELTRDSGTDTARAGNVDGMVLSPNGQFVSFTSTRTQFVFPALGPSGTFRARADARDVYVVDVGARTIERVTRGYSGEDTNGEALASTSISSAGDRVAFASDATNLFYGDANARSDAFVATRSAPPSEEGPPPEPPPAPPPEQAPDTPRAPTLRVTVRRGADKGIVLNVRTPGAGKLTATATGRFPAPAAKGKKKASRKPPLVTMARLTATAGTAGTVVMPIRLTKSIKAKLATAKRVAGTVKVEFAPTPTGKKLIKTVSVTFVPLKTGKR